MELIYVMDVIVLIISAIFCVTMAYRWWRPGGRPEPLLSDLLGVIIVGIVSNAAITGILGVQMGRYVVLAVSCRFRSIDCIPASGGICSSATGCRRGTSPRNSLNECAMLAAGGSHSGRNSWPSIARALVDTGRHAVKTVADTLGVARSNLAPRTAAGCQRGRPPRPEAELLAEIKEAIAGQPTYGYRRVHALIRRHRREHGGAAVNVKRVYRVMKAHRLLLERHSGNGEERRHDGRVAVDRPDTRWCSDGFEIGCDNGDRVRIAFTLDCCDREAISWVATTGGIDSSDIRDLMIESVERRFGLVNRLPPAIESLSDNGSPYTARETRALAREIGLVPCMTPIESPQSNGIAEAFVKTLKRDYARVSPRPTRPACCASSTAGLSTTIQCIRTRRWATARRASSENSWWRRRPRTRSALGVDCMKAQCPRMRSGQSLPHRRLVLLPRRIFCMNTRQRVNAI